MIKRLMIFIILVIVLTKSSNFKIINNDIGKSVSSFKELVDIANMGEIIISGTNVTKLLDIFPYRHGHSAIVIGDGKIIQAPGPSVKSEYVDYTAFGESKKVRLYKVKNATKEQTQNAGEYALNNLIGLTYNVFAGVNDDTVNCTTIIWKAYNEVGIKLKKYLHTARPQTFVEDPQVEVIANLNWKGNPNSFDIDE